MNWIKKEKLNPKPGKPIIIKFKSSLKFKGYLGENGVWYSTIRKIDSEPIIDDLIESWKYIKKCNHIYGTGDKREFKYCPICGEHLRR